LVVIKDNYIVKKNCFAVTNLLTVLVVLGLSALWQGMIERIDFLPDPLHHISYYLMVFLPFLVPRITAYLIMLLKLIMTFLVLQPHLGSPLSETPTDIRNGITATIVFTLLLVVIVEFLYRSQEKNQQVQNDLRQAKEEAENARDAKAEFLARMSHEVRTPLSGIIGITQMLLKDPERYNKENLTHIYGSSEDLLTIINNILDFSKLEANKEVLHHSPFSVKELFLKLSNVYSPLFEEDPHRSFLLEWDPQVPPILISDSVAIQQIVTNLLSNAMKYTTQGRVTLGVEVLTKTPKECQIQWYVRDTGVGIPPQELPELFKDFVRGKNTITRERSGTGLGLAISQRLTRLLGGELSAQSIPGEGSTFYLTLNLPVGESLHHQPVPEEQNPLEPMSTTSQPTVLLAEDNRVNRVYISHFLKKKGINLLEAQNGVEALEIFDKNKKIEGILMDIHMPLLSGIEATVKIREREKYTSQKATPIFAITASLSQEDEEAYQKKGVTRVFSKPLNMEEVYNALLLHFQPENPGSSKEKNS